MRNDYQQTLTLSEQDSREQTNCGAVQTVDALPTSTVVVGLGHYGPAIAAISWYQEILEPWLAPELVNSESGFEPNYFQR
jgi:hypothetical protein